MNSDIRFLEPRLLLAFVMVFDERNVSRAAERMNITQQGLSGMLSRLRQQFDDPLFVRRAHGVIPTSRAESLYPKISSAIKSLSLVLKESTFIPSEIDTVFRIATNDYVLSVVIKPLFERLRKIAPKLKLSVVPLHIDSLREELRNGQIDLALTVPEFVPDNLNTNILFSDRYLCATGKLKSTPNRKMTLEEFCETEHLLVAPNGWNLHSSSDTVLARLGKKRIIGLSVPNFLVALSLLKTTNLIAVLPERILRNNEHQLEVYEPPIEIPSFEIVCAWSDRVDSDPINTWFREILRVLIGDR